MAVFKLGGVAISYPTPDMNGGITTPLISQAESRDLAVDLVVEIREGRDNAVVAHTIKRGELQNGIHELSANEMEELHQQTRQRELVGLVSVHWAETYRRWVEEGRVDPFGHAQKDLYKTA